MLCVYLRQNFLILRFCGRGEAGLVLGQWEGSRGSVKRGQAEGASPGWYLFPVYWFPGGEQALLPSSLEHP